MDSSPRTRPELDGQRARGITAEDANAPGCVDLVLTSRTI